MFLQITLIGVTLVNMIRELGFRGGFLSMIPDLQSALCARHPESNLQLLCVLGPPSHLLPGSICLLIPHLKPQVTILLHSAPKCSIPEAHTHRGAGGHRDGEQMGRKDRNTATEGCLHRKQNGKMADE